MKNFYTMRQWLLCLVAALGLLAACNKDDDAPGAGQVELLSFGPSGVQHGQEIRFIGRNLNRVESIALPGVTVAKSDFTEQTPELIRLVVPEVATEGRVTLNVAGGDAVTSKTILSFEVPVTVTSVTREAKPGTEITITGTKLNWVEGVAFENDTVKQFVSQTPDKVVLRVPLTAKTGKLVIAGGGTEPSFIETEEELIVTLPSATALSPGTVNNGDSLTITGTDLDLVKEVIFTGVGAARVSGVTAKSPTELVVKVPANAATGKLTLVAMSDVEVPTAQELVVALPAVTGLSPTAVKHGENLTLTGANLNLVKEIIFTGVGTAKATAFVSQSPTQLVVKVPDNASKGALKLVAASGVEVTTAQELTIILPAIATVSPSPVDPGQDLTLNGTNLDLVKSIEFPGGGKVTTFVSQSPTQIVVKVPANASKGALKLTTVKDYAVATDAQINVILPAITGVSPEPVLVGNYLTLTGTDLNLVKSVVFTGGATVSAFTAQTPTQLVLAVPAAARTGALTLITHTNLEVNTGKQAQIGTAAPNIAYYIYNDALNADWQKWGGWGTEVQDMENAEHVSRGAKAIKVSFNDAYGALQLHPTKADVLTGYTHLVLYVYGGATDSRLAVQVKNAAGATSTDFPFDVKAGEYKLIEVPVSALGDVSGGISEVFIKNYGTNPNTIYIDDLGLR